MEIVEIQTMIIFCMELAGTIAFAASGAMVGIHCGMDIFGVCVLGVITSVGGGMTRDVILGCVPGALVKPVYVLAAVITALFVFTVLYFRKNVLQGRFGIVYDRIMLVMDSVGLGIFTVMGVMTGIREGYMENVFLLTVLGTLTGVGGGLLRDMMAGQPPYIFVKHIYACASVVGAVSCVWIYRIFGQLPAMVTASALVVVIRFLAAHYRWNLPRIRMER
ncbi:MAG: trimeric intracellular cation channel family protein [Lachnospiraceae bacterium]|nr:trimeric intracellular cation channel family protein [Lachnospiraceae bacterium]